MFKQADERSAKIDGAFNSDAFQKRLANNALLLGDAVGGAYREQINAVLERNSEISMDLKNSP